MGRDSAVAIATRYRLYGPWIEFRWGRGRGPNFSAPVHTDPVAHPAYYAIKEEKRQRRGVNHSPSSSAEVKERVDPYLYCLSMPLWQVTQATLSLYIYIYIYTDQEFIKCGFTQNIWNIHVQYKNTIITEVGVEKKTAWNMQIYLCRSYLFIYLFMKRLRYKIQIARICPC